MQSNLIPGLLGGAAGAILGYFIPRLTTEVVSYKCHQRGKPLPERELPQWVKPLCALILGLFSVSTLLSASGPLLCVKAIYAIFFAAAALTISLTDCSIHLIPNEGVLLLLGTGIVYRLLFEGWSGLLNALCTLGLAILIFGGSSAIFYVWKHQSGLGAGDLKYVFAIAIIVGTSGAVDFLLGMAAAILAYVFFGMQTYRFRMTDYFPMAAHLSCGFLLALVAPYLAEDLTLFGIAH
mgnify:CR=1 FL=1